MHAHSIEQWQHHHAFLGAKHDRHERRTWFVVALTTLMMIAEIVAGTWFGSMALVADGWHMSTNAGALAIAGFAYHFARKHAHDPRFTFGTGKLGELAGFASAVILILVALFIAYESVQRILAPVAISFNEAIAVAAVGLGVNVVSAFLLREEHHDHHESHGQRHHHHGHHDTDARSCGCSNVGIGDYCSASCTLLWLGVDGPFGGHYRRSCNRLMVDQSHSFIGRDSARYGARRLAFVSN